MQTATKLSKPTHWLAGIVSLVVTLVSLGGQLTLAEHYAHAGATSSAFVSREAPTAVSQNSAKPNLFKTSARQPVIKTALNIRQPS